MGFLAITVTGLRAALRDSVNSGAAIWCGADALSGVSLAERQGAAVSHFIYDLGARDPDVLESALDTIEQHHPDEVVWMEAPPAS